MFHVLIGAVYIRGCVKTLFTTDYTDYHRIRMLIISNLKITLCYSVSSVVSFDTLSNLHLNVIEGGGRKRELTLLAPLLTFFTLRAIATVALYPAFVCTLYPLLLLPPNTHHPPRKRYLQSNYLKELPTLLPPGCSRLYKPK